MKKPDVNTSSTLSAPGEPDADLYRILVRTIRDYAILMLDPAGHVRTWNAGAEAIKGYTATDIIGSHFSRFYPPEAVARGIPEHELAVALTEGRFEDEGWRIRKDGSRFWANVVITRMLDGAGRLLGYAKVTRDLSERRRNEETLRQDEERFRTLISGVRDYAIFMLDPQGIVATWNAGAQHIKGYAADEIIGSHFSRFYPPESLAKGLPERELRGATMDGRFEDEGWRIRKDGSRFWANVVITAMRDASGHLLGFSKITRNLTDRRLNEERLKESEERFRLLVDGVAEYAIMMLDTHGLVTSWNVGAERIKGYKSYEILGRHVSHFYPSEAIAENEPWQHLNTARTQGRCTSEGWRVRKDGSLFWAATVVTALRDAEGRPYGFAHVTQDLTQRRHAEALADAAKHMHEFIAMLAHELRNPLAPIRNAVALMGKKGLKDPALESMRQMIDRQSVLMTRLLDDLLDVNRIARGEFEIERKPLDMRDVIARALEVSRPLIDSQQHTLQVQWPRESLPVGGDAVRLTQALVNLLNNAAKYTPPGGHIWLGAVAGAAEVEIRVRDDGNGIARDMLEKVFDLFVQLEPQATSIVGGLGVGLALVRRVAELHGGTIHARSEGKGRGAEFILRLPLAVEKDQVASGESSTPASDLRRLKVLVVDDNTDVADSLKLLLEAMGQDVRMAYDGPSALSAAAAFKPDLVLLDIGMPNMSGYEVARALAADRAAGKPVVVAVTGWGQEADKLRAAEAGFDQHVVKPMSEEALRAILIEVSRSVLQSDPRARASETSV